MKTISLILNIKRKYSKIILPYFLLSLNLIFFLSPASAQIKSSELKAIAKSLTISSDTYKSLRNKSFFTGYQGEVFIVGSSPYKLNGMSTPCFDVIHYSSIVPNNYYLCAKRTGGWGNKSFFSNIAGLKYGRDDSQKKYSLNKSSLKRTPKILEFLEDQNREYGDHRLQMNDQNTFAIGYSLNIPDQLLFFKNLKEQYQEEKIRIISNKRGNFQDIQMSKNGRFAIVIFSNLTLFFEYKNGELINRCTINRGIQNDPFIRNLKEGSFTSVSNSGLVSFHYPNENVYQYKCSGEIESIENPGQSHDSLFISGVSSTADTIAFVSQIIDTDSSQIILYDKTKKEVFGKTKIGCKTPMMVLFSKNKSLLIFNEKGIFEYGLPQYEYISSWKNRITDSYGRITHEKYRFDPEKNIIYNDAQNFLMEGVKTYQNLNSFKDIIIHTLSEGSYLYNLDARVQVSATYDTMWVDHFSKVILTKKNGKFGFIYDDFYSKKYTEKLTDLHLTNSLGAGQYRVFYLQYLNGKKKGITDLSLIPIAEFDADTLVLQALGKDRILFYQKKGQQFNTYDIESNKTLPYSYKSFKHLIKRDDRYLKVTGTNGQGVFSLQYSDEMIPAKYDTINYPIISRFFMICFQDSLMDVYQRNDLLLKLSDNGVDSKSIKYFQSYDFEKFTYYKPNEGYFIFGKNHKSKNDSYFTAGPFEKIISATVHTQSYESILKNKANPVARVIINEKEHLLLEDKTTIQISN